MIKWHEKTQFVEYRSFQEEDRDILDRLIEEANGNVERFIHLFRERFKYFPYLCAEDDWEYELQGSKNLKPVNP